MTKRKRNLLILVIILTIAWVVVFRIGGTEKGVVKEEKTRPQVKVLEIARQDEIRSPIVLSGTIKPKKYILVKSAGNGFLQEVAPIGEAVRAGDELFRIYDEGTETNYYNALNGVMTAEANLKQAEATTEDSLKQADLGVKSAEAAFELAKSSYENIRKSAGFSLDLAENNLKTAKLNAEQSLAGAMDAGEASYSGAYNAVDQILRLLSKDGTIGKYAFEGWMNYNSRAREEALNQFERAKTLYSNISNSAHNISNNNIEVELEEMEGAIGEVKKAADLAYVDLNYCLPDLDVSQGMIDGEASQLVYLTAGLNGANSAIKGAKNGIKSAKINGEGKRVMNWRRRSTKQRRQERRIS